MFTSHFKVDSASLTEPAAALEDINRLVPDESDCYGKYNTLRFPEFLKLLYLSDLRSIRQLILSFRYDLCFMFIQK